MKVKIEEVHAGDQFREGDFTHWTAVQDAVDREDGITVVRVQFADHGVDYRSWDTGTEIEIARP
jgi:hypothetical protein